MISPTITWTKNGKEFEYPSQWTIWAMPSVRENVGNRPMIISFLKFEASSGTGLQCCEDGFLWEEIKCEATHPSFKQPISQYFKLVYETFGFGRFRSHQHFLPVHFDD